MIDKQLLKGSLKTVVLHLLSKQAMHGYQLSTELKKISDGNFTITEGTLYPLLHSLDADGFVKSIVEEGPSKRKRKIYILTELGMDALIDKKQQWLDYKVVMENLLAGKKALS